MPQSFEICASPFFPPTPHLLGSSSMLERGPVMEMAVSPSKEKHWHLLLTSGHWIDVDIVSLLKMLRECHSSYWNVLLKIDTYLLGWWDGAESLRPTQPHHA